MNALRRLQDPKQLEKIWLKFSIKNQNGVVENYRILDLSKDSIDHYVNFQMNHFVRREFTHILAGLCRSEKAMDEYKDVLKHTCATPPYHSIVCCPEVDGRTSREIIATSTVKMIKKRDEYGFDYPAKTKEVKQLFKILRDWNSLFPISDIMEKYAVDTVFEYDSLTVHKSYIRSGLATKIGSIGKEICNAYNVPMRVAWMTSEGSKKAAEINGWTNEFQIRKDDLAKKLKVKMENTDSSYPLIHLMIAFSDIRKEKKVFHPKRRIII